MGTAPELVVLVLFHRLKVTIANNSDQVNEEAVQNHLVRIEIDTPSQDLLAVLQYQNNYLSNQWRAADGKSDPLNGLIHLSF